MQLVTDAYASTNYTRAPLVFVTLGSQGDHPQREQTQAPGRRTKPIVAYLTTPHSSAFNSICGRLPSRAQMELKATGDGQS